MPSGSQSKLVAKPPNRKWSQLMYQNQSVCGLMIPFWGGSKKIFVLWPPGAYNCWCVCLKKIIFVSAKTMRGPKAESTCHVSLIDASTTLDLIRTFFTGHKCCPIFIKCTTVDLQIPLCCNLRLWRANIILKHHREWNVIEKKKKNSPTLSNLSWKRSDFVEIEWESIKCDNNRKM